MRLLLIALVALLPLSAYAADESVTLNFRETDLRTVLETVSRYTGKNFVVAPKVKGTVTVVTAAPIPKDAVYEVFLTALRQNGFAAVEKGAVVSVVPTAEAKGADASVGADGTGERLVTRIFVPHHADAAVMLPVVKSMAGSSGAIEIYPPANALIAFDTAGNLERIGELIHHLDRAPGGEVRRIPLTHLTPHEFIDLYERLYVTGGLYDGKGMKNESAGQLRLFTLTPDLRSNALLARSEDTEALDRLMELVALLDVPAAKERSVRVIPLKFADAEELAKTLNEFVNVKQGTAPADTSGEETATLKIGVRADPANRRLIISAPPALGATLDDMIRQLDIRKPQIFVEALIAEISASTSAEFGVQWGSLSGFDSSRHPGTTGVGGVNLAPVAGGTLADVAQSGNMGAGINVGIVAGSITLPDGSVVPNLLAMAHALENRANANILSAPTLLALDNEEAEIIVGQNVPLVTGSYATTGGNNGAVNPFQTFERKDIGLNLKIKPRVSDGSSIRLALYQEVSSVAPVTARNGGGASDVVTNKRSLSTTILAENGQMVVIGGLIQDDVSVTENKVPLLGDIPIIGELFRYETRSRVKTNLMVFLRPYILHEAESSVSLTDRAYRYVIEEQGMVRMEPHFILPDLHNPALTELRPEATSADPELTAIETPKEKP